MLRITAQNEPATVTLKLEGDVTGVWVRELFDTWEAALRDLGGRELRIDLTDVRRIDQAGEYLLALMRCTSATQLVGAGTVTADLIRTISRTWTADCENANKEA